MWTVKFVASTEDTSVGRIAAKYGVVVQLYPLLSNLVEGSCVIQFSGIVYGAGKSVQKFMVDFSRLPNVQKFERRDNLIFFSYREKAEHADFYNPNIIFLEPWTINGEKRTHYIYVGAWDREHAVAVFNNIKKTHSTKLLKLSKCAVPNIVFCTVRPNLTKKQKEALELAAREGYYEYPRKKSVQDLAVIAGLSFSTFQAHLRKAERQLIPYSLRMYSGDTYR